MSLSCFHEYMMGEVEMAPTCCLLPFDSDLLYIGKGPLISDTALRLFLIKYLLETGRFLLSFIVLQYVNSCVLFNGKIVLKLFFL